MQPEKKKGATKKIKRANPQTFSLLTDLDILNYTKNLVRIA
jgi:hypothetical protein